MFLPATRGEMQTLGWERPDVVLVTGDAYVDSPYFGVALIGKALLHAGFRVVVVAQPDTANDTDIGRLGEPSLFWGVTAGATDSLVANYTAAGKRRRQDDLTGGGVNDRRPDRAVIVYANLIRRAFRPAKPIVLGGLEASLRRLAHFDHWSGRVRRSILADAKADWLLYGMAEETVVSLARRLRDGKDVRDLPGLCRLNRERPDGALVLPGYGDAAADIQAFQEMDLAFRANTDPRTARTLCQRQDSRYLVQNPPPRPLSQTALDAVHDLDYARDAHPVDLRRGPVRAVETIRFSLPSHRGCYGECSFCSVSAHQGRIVTWRSEASLLREARILTTLPDFKGVILDVGGPTANMYGFECRRKLLHGACPDRHCLHPQVCPSLGVRHDRQTRLLGEILRIPGIRRVFVASGIRHDLVMADRRHGEAYLAALVRRHVSGQLKVAPEHSAPRILQLMRKPDASALEAFKDRFDRACRDAGTRLFLSYYFMAAHPGCTDGDMESLRTFVQNRLRLHPQQVQVFTPTPSTLSTLMYLTEKDPVTGQTLFVEKDRGRRERQKAILLGQNRTGRKPQPNPPRIDKPAVFRQDAPRPRRSGRAGCPLAGRGARLSESRSEGANRQGCGDMKEGAMAKDKNIKKDEKKPPAKTAKEKKAAKKLKKAAKA